MQHLGIVVRVLAGLVVALFSLLSCGNVLRVLAHRDFMWWGVGGVSILVSLAFAAALGWLAFKMIVGAFVSQSAESSPAS